MVQERRGMLRVWNLSLLCATFSLTILGTFLTRSGVIESVHAFSDGDIGIWHLSFFGLVVAVTLGPLAWLGDRLRAPGRIASALSREGALDRKSTRLNSRHYSAYRIPSLARKKQ